MNNTIVGILALVCLALYLQRRRARLSAEE
jgi:hypothetical protein